MVISCRWYYLRILQPWINHHQQFVQLPRLLESVWLRSTLALINSFTAMLAAPSLWKLPMKVPNVKPLRLFVVAPFPWAREKISIKMDSTESRFVIGRPNILFGVVYMCTFQPGNFTGCGSEGVNTWTLFLPPYILSKRTLLRLALVCDVRVYSCYSYQHLQFCLRIFTASLIGWCRKDVKSVLSMVSFSMC